MPGGQLSLASWPASLAGWPALVGHWLTSAIHGVETEQRTLAGFSNSRHAHWLAWTIAGFSNRRRRHWLASRLAPASVIVPRRKGHRYHSHKLCEVVNKTLTEKDKAAKLSVNDFIVRRRLAGFQSGRPQLWLALTLAGLETGRFPHYLAYRD